MAITVACTFTMEVQMGLKKNIPRRFAQLMWIPSFGDSATEFPVGWMLTIMDMKVFHASYCAFPYPALTPFVRTDIAIGSYASAHAIIFRSKPMLVVTGEIKSSVAKLPLNADGFKLTSCIRYTGHKVPSKLGTPQTV